MGTMNGYLRDYVTDINATAAFHRAGNGAFLYSCHEHCEELAAGWSQHTIGGVAMKDAARAWWLADDEPAASHTFLPCEYHTAPGVPHKCNPTCLDMAGGGSARAAAPWLW